MTHLIDKSALVAEIDRLDNFYHLSKGAGGQAFIEDLLSFLNTLEVKEVDVEKEFYDFLDTLIGKDYEHLSEYELFMIAEHFFELGLKAQKP